MIGSLRAYGTHDECPPSVTGGSEACGHVRAWCIRHRKGGEPRKGQSPTLKKNGTYTSHFSPRLARYGLNLETFAGSTGPSNQRTGPSNEKPRSADQKPRPLNQKPRSTKPETSFPEPENSFPEPETSFRRSETSFPEPETSFLEPETSFHRTRNLVPANQKPR